MFSRSVHLGSSWYVLWRELLKLVKDWDQKDAFGSLGTGKSKRASICNVSMQPASYTPYQSGILNQDLKHMKHSKKDKFVSSSSTGVSYRLASLPKEILKDRLEPAI